MKTRARRSQLRSVKDDRRGQALVELAIILPMMLLLLVGAIDLGRAFYTYIGMDNAAREGAAFGMWDPENEAGIVAAARQEMGGDTSLDVPAPVCDPGPSCEPIGGGNKWMTVTVDYSFSFIMPLLPDLELSTSSTAVIQVDE